MSEVMVPIVFAGREIDAPRWFTEGLRLLIFRFPRCKCGTCAFCMETDRLAGDWLGKYDR